MVVSAMGLRVGLGNVKSRSLAALGMTVGLVFGRANVAF
jgi:hypothetical protein